MLELQNTIDERKDGLAGEFFRRIAENVAEVLYSASFAGGVRFEYVNKRAESLTGMTVDDMLADSAGWLKLVHLADFDRLNAAHEQCRETCEMVEVEYRLVRADESVCEVVDRMSPVFADDGSVVGIDGVLHDVTDRNKAKRDLDRTQMLQTIGRLSAGIAHEINTPIQFIGDNLRFLSDSFADVFELIAAYGDAKEAMAKTFDTAVIDAAEEQADIEFLVGEIPQAIEQSLEGVARVADMVGAMRHFSHIDERRMAPADINKALKGTLVMLRNEIKYVADVKVELADDLPEAICCIDNLNQVFLNIITNAAHSIADVVNRDGGRGVVTVTSAVEGGQIVVTISDTGAGIKAENRERVFEPFFTTKQSQKGTGQGLSICWSIVVDRHHGCLSFESIEGVGTTFIIRLPIEGDSRG